MIGTYIIDDHTRLLFKKCVRYYIENTDVLYYGNIIYNTLIKKQIESTRQIKTNITEIKLIFAYIA